MKSILTIISLALAFVSPAFAGIEWGFPDGTLSVAGASFGSPGSGTATIGLGPLHINPAWQNGSTFPYNYGGVPGASGFWDLGQAGSIVLHDLSGSGLTTLTVFQWVDSGIYSGTLNYSVNGGPVVGSLTAIGEIASSGPTGAWWEYAANLGAFDPAQVTITAPGGAIIDRVTLTLVPEPATMIAGAILLIPFALSTWPILRRRRK